MATLIDHFKYVEESKVTPQGFVNEVLKFGSVTAVLGAILYLFVIIDIAVYLKELLGILGNIISVVIYITLAIAISGFAWMTLGAFFMIFYTAVAKISLRILKIK